jgi:hypothetical protein
MARISRLVSYRRRPDQHLPIFPEAAVYEKAIVSQAKCRPPGRHFGYSLRWRTRLRLIATSNEGFMNTTECHFIKLPRQSVDGFGGGVSTDQKEKAPYRYHRLPSRIG